MLKAQSTLRLGILLALSSATLTACASSPAADPPSVPQPVLATRVETRTACPPELLAPVPEAISLPAGATLQGSPEGLNYVARRFAREDLLDAVIADARLSCPASPPPPDPRPPDD